MPVDSLGQLVDAMLYDALAGGGADVGDSWSGGHHGEHAFLACDAQQR